MREREGARGRVLRMAASVRAPGRSPMLQVVKSAVAAIATWLLAGWLFPGPVPVFGAIAALLVVQPSLNQSFSKAVERSVGVIAGVVLASALGLVFGSQTWVVLVAIAAALMLAWVLKMTPGTANQVAISALLVLAIGTATPEYALDRVLETLLGAVVGIVVNVAVVPPVAVAPARAAIDALGAELAASFGRLADALEQPRTPAELEGLLIEARLMRPMLEKAQQAIDAGAESLTLNPRGGRHRAELADLDRVGHVYSPIVTQLIGMTRAVYDRYSPDLADEPLMRAIAEQLRRAQHDIGLIRGREAGTPAMEPPALTTPLRIDRPPSTHWVLIGSLLEDLHRIHTGLADSV